MAKIPSYDSQLGLRIERVTSQAPGVEINPLALTQSARALGELGQAASQVGQKIYTLQAQGELSRAKTESYGGLRSIEETEDIEPQGWLERRDKEVKDLREQIRKSMRNPLARSQFEAEFDRDILDTQFKLKKSYTTLTIGDTLSKFYDERQAIEEKIFSGLPPQEEENEISKIGARYAEFGRNGAMTPQAALKEYRTWQAQLPELKADADILQNPVYAMGELQKGEEGKYKGLPIEKRTDLIKSAETRIEKIQNQQKENIVIAQNQREASLIDLKINGTLTELIVKQERNAGSISAQFADSLIKALRNPKITQTKSTSFNKMADFILNTENKSEDIRLELLKENAMGKLSDEDFNALFTFNQQMKINDENLALPKGLNFWHTEYANNDSEIRARMFKDYIQRVNKGEEPALVVDAVIKKEILMLHPQATFYPKEGKKIIDIFGVIKRIFPTLEIKDNQETGDAD